MVSCLNILIAISLLAQKCYLDIILSYFYKDLLMYLQLLREIKQDHIVDLYTQAGEPEKQALDTQISRIQAAYPGGLKAYYHNGIRLLKESALGVNPYASYEIGKPKGVSISYSDLDTWQKYEEIGFSQFENAAFVLVAGGLGERLGYPGIKVSIPNELLTSKSFLQYYCEYIIAFEDKFCEGKPIPLAIMTSDDTHDKTLQLLQSNNYFKLKKEQVIILNQEKVPTMVDNQAHFGLVSNKLQIETKPHGHGDVHTLLHMSKTAQKWSKQGKKWIIIFQDTNPFALRSFALLLGVSSQRNLDFNSLGVPRKPGEAVGAITTLVHKQTKKLLTVNVEYNQLQSLFKESGGEPVDQNGFSTFPGNTNCFAIKLDTYVKVLTQTQGLINEFINPKYADSTKTKFKSSTRLQCLMQDYPKLLQNCDNVGFTDVPRGYCFTTVKNDLGTANTKIRDGLFGEGAGSCESDIYFNNRLLLRLCGAQIEQSKLYQAGGANLPLFPMISFSPAFATCLTELKNKVKNVKISGKSSLVIEKDCILQNVELDGHYEIHKGGSISLNHNDKDYYQVGALQGNQQPYLKIRGYKLIKPKVGSERFQKIYNLIERIENQCKVLKDFIRK